MSIKTRQQKLLRVNVSAWSLLTPRADLHLPSSLSANDAAICISYSGATKDVLESMSVARSNGAKIIAIVGNPRSALAESADVFLLTISSEPPFRSGSMISRLCQLAMIDLLTLGIATNRKDEILEQFTRKQRTMYQRSMNVHDER